MKNQYKLIAIVSTLTLVAQTNAPAQVLMNRYSFNDTPGSGVAVDSVSGANGSLNSGDGSDFDGSGHLTLNGSGGYVALPSGMISSYQSVTIETWVTWYGGGTDIQRLFDFGGFSGGTADANRTYMFFTPSVASVNGDAYGKVTKSPTAANSTQIFLYDTTDGALPVATEAYVAMVFDPSNPTAPGRLYINGALVASTTYSPAFPLSSIADTDCFLGQANTGTQTIEGTGTAGGPNHWFFGQLDEFRIWNGVLPDAQIAQNFTDGPDATIALLPKLNIVPAGGNVTISWPTNGADGFQLFSTAVVSPASWTSDSHTPAVAGANWTVTEAASGTAKFFRLQK